MVKSIKFDCLQKISTEKMHREKTEKNYNKKFWQLISIIYNKEVEKM